MSDLSSLIADFLDAGGHVDFHRHHVTATWTFHEWEWSDDGFYDQHDDDPRMTLQRLHEKMTSTIQQAREEAHKGNRVLVGDTVLITSDLIDRHGRYVPEGISGIVQGGLMNFWPDMVPVLTDHGSILAPSEYVERIIDTTSLKSVEASR